MQEFQESVLAESSLSGPISLMPGSFFPQTFPVVTGPRRLPPHNTMLLSLGEASACQWHSKTRSSYLNLFFLDNVLEQNIHISLAGFSGGLGWLFTVINSLMSDFICSYPWKCWTIIAELFLFLWSCYWETINLTVFFGWSLFLTYHLHL